MRTSGPWGYVPAMETCRPGALAGREAACKPKVAPGSIPAMNLKLVSAGLILAAISLQGCAQTYKEAADTYRSLKADIGAYEPVGDPKIDGLAKPFVTEAGKLQAEFDKVKAEMEASPLTKNFGDLSESDYAKAYAALSPADKKLVDDALRSAAKADKARTEAMMTQLADLAVAGGRLTVEIKDAAGGGAGGAGALASTAGNLAGGAGKQAIAQVEEAIKFSNAAKMMIEQYSSLPGKIAKAIETNVRKAQA